MKFDESVHAGTVSGALKAKRQHVMVLCLATSALDGEVRAWSVYDPSVEKRPTAGDSDVPPYATGLDALKDGWRVIQFPQLIPPAQGSEYSTSYMRFEFIFEKMEEIE